jgi:2-C-methyl-D-erythritol 4-phosphate cytidylyltransferase
LGTRVTGVTGGATRADSVRAGLDALGGPPAVVVVHDAARPFVDTTTITAVIARARSGVGAVAAVPIGDTVKDVDDDGRVARTVARSRLWRAQTPQAFPGAMLAAGYARWPSDAPPPTDDAEAVERAGFPVEVVAGSSFNLKVTTEEDWRVAEALARELG